MRLQFAVGEVPEEHKQAVQDEEAKHGSFLHLPVKVRAPLHAPCAVLMVNMTPWCACPMLGSEMK
jgi:hypothetical protein